MKKKSYLVKILASEETVNSILNLLTDRNFTAPPENQIIEIDIDELFTSKDPYAKMAKEALIEGINYLYNTNKK